MTKSRLQFCHTAFYVRSFEHCIVNEKKTDAAMHLNIAAKCTGYLNIIDAHDCANPANSKISEEKPLLQ